MTFCMYMNQITPHLMPLAREAVKLLGAENVRYIYEKELELSRVKLGWNESPERWVLHKVRDAAEAGYWLDSSDILICERRELDLWERRAKSGKGMYYTSERWFKPIHNHLPGWLRLLSPKFFHMFRGAVKLFDRHPNLVYLADGYYAAEDFVRLRDIMHGKIWTIFCRPNVEAGKFPLSDFVCRGKGDKQLKMWGYFVAPSSANAIIEKKDQLSKVLWIGRYLVWKRVDTIIKAVLATQDLTLDLYGQGPEEQRLKNLAGNSSRIVFHGPVPGDEVRRVMREHDVYILSSNEYEGWGAVVNEAIEEGMVVVGTYEAGASRAILPSENLYHVGDWKGLACVLNKSPSRIPIGEWSVKSVAWKLLAGAIKDGTRITNKM